MRISDWSSDVCSSDLLFAALRHAGITTVVVTFDGSGDSGQIEDIQAHAGDQLADIPTTPVEIARLDFHARSEEHTSELQSLMRISYAVFCLKKKNKTTQTK